MGEREDPPSFCCPIGLDVMKDPVFSVAVSFCRSSRAASDCGCGPLLTINALKSAGVYASFPPVRQTGHTFERDCIEAHLAKSSRCPLSGVDVHDKTLMPNHALRNAIQVVLRKK